jgi:nucleotide-binding universal stress UspA family protein
MLPVKTILAPYDFSRCASRALDAAWTLARTAGAKVVVLHVMQPSPVAFGAMMIPPPGPDAGFVNRVRADLEAIKPPRPGIAVEHRLEQGDAVGHIVRAAQALPADVIVMGTHGRSGLKRLLLGSVAEGVLRKAPCPVLSVKLSAKAEADAEESAPAAATAG